MIPAGKRAFVHINLSGQERLSALARDRARVTVEVLSALEDGRAKVLVDGKPFVATLPAGYAPGSAFRALLREEGGLVILVPLPGEVDPRGPSGPAPAVPAPATIAERLRLPETPAALFLVSFYSGLNARLDPRQIRRVAAVAARFPGREEDAAEAAAMLAERGLEADDAEIEALMSILRGETYRSGQGAGGEDAEGFLKGMNSRGKPGSRWIVIPFRRMAAGGYSGSLRFLFEEESRAVRGLRVGAMIDGHSVRVNLGDDFFSFSVNPQIPAMILEKTELYLNAILVESGFAPHGQADISGYGPVDVRA